MAVVHCIVWICPTPGCGNYYASSAVGDLSVYNTDRYERPTFRRSRCPVCATRGTEVDRVPVIVDVNPMTARLEVA